VECTPPPESDCRVGEPPSYPHRMPVIVIGADTPGGIDIVRSLLARDGEVRAFVSDPDVGADLKKLGVKVAIGDVSDGSHIEAAALAAFSAVAITEAATDGRERSFAEAPRDVLVMWAEALANAGVRRVIAVGSTEPDPAALRTAAPEFAIVDPGNADPTDLARRVATLDEATSL